MVCFRLVVSAKSNWFIRTYLIIPHVRDCGDFGPGRDALQTFRELDARARHLAEENLVCQRLMSAPSVSFVTALTFKAAVDDPRCFKQSRTVAVHFGLTQRRPQSGEMDVEEHISKSGDAQVLAMLYAAANAMLMCSGHLPPDVDR